MLLNNRLMQEVSELQQEVVLVKEIPRRLQESVTNCKNVYKDALSIFQVNIYLCSSHRRFILLRLSIEIKYFCDSVRIM